MKKTNVVLLLGYLVFMLASFSCSKQRSLPSATLSLRFGNTSEDVEWREVSGSRFVNSGNLYIVATGFENEKFELELHNVADTGLIQNVSINNISYANGYGFETGSLKLAIIRIIELNSNHIKGGFEVEFINQFNNTDVINARGEFTILGQE